MPVDAEPARPPQRIHWLAAAIALALVAGCLPGPPGGEGGGPRERGRPVAVLVGPEAGATPILDLIASARTSLWMQMYLLTDERAIAALETRARAGCEVRLALEPAPYQAEAANQPAYARLAGAQVNVRWTAARFTFTHAKAFIVDHARLVVMTLNLTAAGLAGNREYAVVDDDPADVAAAEALFLADEAGAAAPAGGRVVSSPERSRATLAELIGTARASLFVQTEQLTDPAMVGAIADARARGVAVTVVGPGPASSAAAGFRALAEASVPVRLPTAPVIHAKAVVADGRRVYLGSVNLTPTSLDENRELGLLLADPAAAELVSSTIATDAARGLSP